VHAKKKRGVLALARIFLRFSDISLARWIDVDIRKDTLSPWVVVGPKPA
jgi:hypothetical protein